MSSIEFRLLKQDTKQNAQNQNSHTQGSAKARTEAKAQECSEPLFYDSALLYELFPHCTQLDSVSIATLLASTRVVGMKVPGLHSIYSSLELACVNSSLGNQFVQSLYPASLRRMSNTPHSQGKAIAQSNTANTRIVGGEIQDSKTYSESTACHSERSEESTNRASRDTSNFRPQYGKRLESTPHASLESASDSETPSGGAYLHRDKNQIARSANLEASSGWGIVKGEGATSQFKPLPLNKKEKKESEEVLESKEVKARDSEKWDLKSKELESAIDSESKNKAESAMVGDSKKRDLESEKQAESTGALDSEKLESAIDSESKKPKSHKTQYLESTTSTQKPTQMALRYTHSTHPLLNLTTIRINAPMQGIIKAFIRPQRLKNASLNALYTQHKSVLDSKPFKAQRALVIGASSGLGNACAKLLYLGGAQVCVTSHSTPFDEPLIPSLPLNALKPSNESLQALARFAPTHLYYFATPKISSTQGIKKQELSAYLNAYIFAPLRLLELLKPKAFFQPSSVFVEELPLEFASYSIAKGAMEHFSASLRRLGIHTATPRLPKVATNQTLSLIPQKLANPADSILCELLAFTQNPLAFTQNKEK